jgi:hypothetical protein
MAAPSQSESLLATEPASPLPSVVRSEQCHPAAFDHAAVCAPTRGVFSPRASRRALGLMEVWELSSRRASGRMSDLAPTACLDSAQILWRWYPLDFAREGRGAWSSLCRGAMAGTRRTWRSHLPSQAVEARTAAVEALSDGRD